MAGKLALTLDRQVKIAYNWYKYYVNPINSGEFTYTVK